MLYLFVIFIIIDFIFLIISFIMGNKKAYKNFIYFIMSLIYFFIADLVKTNPKRKS